MKKNRDETCPFCGSDKIRVQVNHVEPHSMVSRGRLASLFIECSSCEARGPVMHVTVDDGQGHSKQFSEVRKLWNTRNQDIPVINSQGKFLGYITRKSITRSPQYDGERFYLSGPDVLSLNVNDRSRDVEVVMLEWHKGSRIVDGREITGWILQVCSNEKFLWQLGDVFTSWVERHPIPDA